MKNQSQLSREEKAMPPEIAYAAQQENTKSSDHRRMASSWRSLDLIGHLSIEEWET